MAGETAFEGVFEFRFSGNNFFVTVFAVHVGGTFEGFYLLVQTGSFEMTALAFGDFLSFFIGDLLAVFGTVMAITAFCDFLVLGMREYRWFGLGCFVLFSLQYHICRTVIRNNNTGAAEKNNAEYTQNNFPDHNVRSF
jgi:hypothetical protein